MPILDIQARFRELGRIRAGVKVDTGKKNKQGRPIMRPTKLPRFRLTSPWQHLIEQAAGVFGGDPRPWDNEGAQEWEVIVDVEALPVAVPPGVEVMAQWYERWEGGGLLNRCDGLQQVLVAKPCRCPADPLERAEAATKGAACKPTTRLRLMLPDVADVGIWRLETHGWHAATELAGAASLIEFATRRGVIVPADLRLHAREGARRPGKVRTKFFVPAISFRGALGDTLAALGLDVRTDTPVSLSTQGRPALDAGGTPALGPATGLEPERRAVEAPSLPPPAPPAPAELPDYPEFDVDLEPGPPPNPDPAPSPIPDDVEDPEAFTPPPPAEDPQTAAEGPRMTGAQVIAIRLRDRGVTDRAHKLRVVAAMVGRPISSAKDLTAGETRMVLDALADDTYTLPTGPTSSPDEALEEAPGPLERETAPPATGVRHTPPAAPGTEILRGEVTGAGEVDDGTGEPFEVLTAARWGPNRWRAYFAARRVKAVEVFAEARRLAAELGEDAPTNVGALAVASPSLVGLLLSFIEERFEERSGGDR